MQVGDEEHERLDEILILEVLAGGGKVRILFIYFFMLPTFFALIIVDLVLLAMFLGFRCGCQIRVHILESYPLFFPKI